MTKRDGRAFDHKTLEAIRIRAVQRIEEDGETPSEVMRALGFARTVVYNWLAKYRTGGLAALRSLPIPGRPPKLRISDDVDRRFRRKWITCFGSKWITDFGGSGSLSAELDHPVSGIVSAHR